MEHSNQLHQANHDDWHLRKLWQYAKNRGFNIRVDNGFIQLTPSTQLNATSARSFPWNAAGIQAARAWLDNPISTHHEPAEQTTVLPTTTRNNIVSGTKNGTGRMIGWIIGFIITGALVYVATNLGSPDYSKPWWSGTLTMNVCAVGQNAKNYLGASLGNYTTGCFMVPVTSNGTKITNVTLSGLSYFTVGTDCGEMDASSSTPKQWYCDFNDDQNRQWEVMKPL